jgi:hypothetical protein
MRWHRRNILKLIHFASTAWFMLCIVYILTLALRQAGTSWWVIFSLSGHSALAVFLVISLYLFAVFRGVDRSQKIEIEHPLTSTAYYNVFYDISPFLGSLAGYIGATGVKEAGGLFLSISLGTFGMTFLVWVIVDPVIGYLERLFPTSRRHRLLRLAEAREQKLEKQEAKKQFLADILLQEKQDHKCWQESLRPCAEKIVQLLSDKSTPGRKAQEEAVELGVSAWQMGGLNCMRYLHEMIMDICKKSRRDSLTADYLSTWWDGIGSWRSAC